MSKKTYNPFKMWGSYVGAIIGLILFIIEISAKGNFSFIARLIENIAILIYEPIRSSMGFGLLVIPTIMIIAGFLIGYLIHSLIRGLRR